MRITVNLQGHEAEWCAPGSASLSAWLRAFPWRTGGICAIDCAVAVTTESMFEAIASTVYGVNGVNSKLRVELLNNFEGERVSPFMAIKRLLGIDEALNHYESVRAARAELSEFDYVFVFVTAAGFDQRWWEEIRGLADLLEKGQPAVCLCAIALDPWCAIDSVPRFDFLRALPAPDVLSMSDASDSALWRRYETAAFLRKALATPDDATQAFQAFQRTDIALREVSS